jgi:hypothetical protein
METSNNNPEPPPDAGAVSPVNSRQFQELIQQYEATTDPRVKREVAEAVCRQIELYVQREQHALAPAVHEETDSAPQTLHIQQAIENILERAKQDMLRLFQTPSPELPRWKPANHESYYIILGGGDIRRFQWHGTAFDEEAWHFGNCFRVRQDAEEARDAVKEVFLNFHNRHATRERLRGCCLKKTPLTTPVILAKAS